MSGDTAILVLVVVVVLAVFWYLEEQSEYRASRRVRGLDKETDEE